MTQDFFDQDTGRNDENVPTMDRPDGASILVNGSYQRLEEGAPFLQSVQQVALSAGFGKFKVWLNGTEVRPSTAPAEVRPDHRVEIKPFDEAG
jgi:hypothetical protein